MKNTQRYAFTLVELLITITILALIAVVAFTSFGVRQNNAVNTKITSEVETLTNALLAYKQEKGELPMPKGNINFFAEDTSYVHSYTGSNIFGAHGFITNDTLPKRYIDVLPVDPRTGAFYAYGKTKGTGSIDEMYEIAGIVLKNESPISYVTGDYTAETGPFNLIRSYNGPNFVQDGSQSNFPYNPTQRILTAKIDDYSGIVTINGNTYSESKILNFELRTGDTIFVGTGGTVELYYSDGSRSVLGDTSQATKLTLQKMEYPQDNNLVTDIKLILEAGMIWNKAASLDKDSGFEIYTTDSTAAVRGTEFGVQKNPNNTQIIVKQGSVKVDQNIITGSTSSPIDIVKNAINNNDITLLNLTPIIISGVTDYNSATQESIIKVNENTPEVGVEITSSDSPTSNTGAINDIPTEVQDIIINNIPIFNDNISIRLLDYIYTDGDISITLNVSNKIAIGSDFILLKGKGIDASINEKIILYSDDLIFTNQPNSTKNITLTKSTLVNNYRNLLTWIDQYRIIELEISFGEESPRGIDRTTKSVKLALIKDKSYKNDNIEEERKKEAEKFNELAENINNKKCQAPFIYNSAQEVCPNEMLTASGWTLTAYAPYNSTGSIYTATGTILPTSSGITFTNGALLVNESDSLQYNIDINTIGEKFTIEMNVKGNDLNRESNHQLFKLGNLSIYINDKKLYNNFGKNLPINNIDGGKYYNVIFEYDNRNSSLYVVDQNNNIIISRIDKFRNKNNNLLLIGYENFPSIGMQWKGPIDYLKIYTK